MWPETDSLSGIDVERYNLSGTVDGRGNSLTVDFDLRVTCGRIRQ